jgi:hypothetical protein
LTPVGTEGLIVLREAKEAEGRRSATNLVHNMRDIAEAGQNHSPLEDVVATPGGNHAVSPRRC